jgi:hypothetical protein
VPGLVAERLVEVVEGEPTTVNDPAPAKAARSLLPEASFGLAPPMRSCGSDDFGFYGRVALALMVFVRLRAARACRTCRSTTRASCRPARLVGVVACPGRRLHGRCNDSLALTRSKYLEEEAVLMV